jgi:hypothetical protein
MLMFQKPAEEMGKVAARGCFGAITFTQRHGRMLEARVGRRVVDFLFAHATAG